MRPAPARFPVLRRPPTRVLVALLLAIVAGLLVHRLNATAAATVDRWGATTSVWVAAEDLAVGHVLGPGDATREARPAAFVPADAVTDDPTGRTIRSEVVHSEVLTGLRLSGGARPGVAALVPDGWRAVAVPVHDAALPVRPGDRVDVLAAGDPAAVGGSAGAVVASGAVVVHVDEDGTVTVAVPADRVTRVAAALVGAVVTLALAP